MSLRPTPLALFTVLAVAIAAVSWGCASSRTSSGPLAQTRDGQGPRAESGQTASPREVVEQHAARIERLRTRMTGDTETVTRPDGGHTLDETERKLERQVDAAPQRESTSPDACEDTCLLAQEICSSSETICEVAEGSAPPASRDVELVETCRWASATCDASLEVCVACRAPIVRGE